MSLINAKVPAVQSSLNLGSGGGGSGLTSLNALTGVVNLTSTDTSISITADAVSNTINLQTAGGGGGVEGTLYVGTLTTVDSPSIVGSVAERVVGLGAFPAPVAVVAGQTYRYQLVLEDFTLTNGSLISTPSSQCGIMPYVGNTATQPPAQQESLWASVFTPSPFGVLTTDVSPYEVTIVAQPAPPSSQVLSFPSRFVTDGIFVADSTSAFLNVCWSGLQGAGFNPNALNIVAGTAVPFQLLLSRVNLL